MICCRRRSGRCCGGCRSSRGAGRWQRRRRGRDGKCGGRWELEGCGKGVGGGQWDGGGPEGEVPTTSLLLGELPTTHCPLPTAAEAGLRLAGSLWWFWLQRGYFEEGRQRLAAALTAGGG